MSAKENEAQQTRYVSQKLFLEKIEKAKQFEKEQYFREAVNLLSQ